MFRVFVASILGLIGSSIAAEARHFTQAPECNVTMPCDFSSAQAGMRYTRPQRLVQRVAAAGHPVLIASASAESTEIIGGRPAGCPRMFCGCGASIRVFGHIVPELNLAANWLRFPRTLPGPGMVAARRGHVFVLERPAGDGLWMAYDANSGGHATRIHAVSLRGYAIVNPHGA